MSEVEQRLRERTAASVLRFCCQSQMERCTRSRCVIGVARSWLPSWAVRGVLCAIE